MAFLSFRDDVIKEAVTLHPSLKEWKNGYGYSLAKMGYFS
jgi:hypothetical protein